MRFEMDACGTIKVYIRQKPGSEPEKNNNQTDTPKCTLSNLQVFDKVFREKSNQEFVFRCSIKRMILNALDGQNITTIAYGCTQSGRTYTIFGGLDVTKTEDAGLLPRSVEHLFEVLEEEHLEYSIHVSYLEIYNEQLFDLLSPNDDDTKLIITEDILHKDCVIIKGLTEEKINNMNELHDLLKKGAHYRLKSSVLLNSIASERHALFYVTVYTKEECINGETVLKRGKLIFVDVAASNYSAQFGQTNVSSLEETKHQSLNTFNKCLSKLADKSTDIPYGESKLTQLLQESLGGSTRTIIFATIDFNSLETGFTTDDFAHTAKKIEARPWIKHVFNKNTVIEQYTMEINKLDTDIVNIVTKQNIALNAGDTNIFLNGFEENKKTISDKIKRVKILKDFKNRWLTVYKNFEKTVSEPEKHTTEMSENGYFESIDFQNFVSRYTEKTVNVGEEHVQNVQNLSEIISKQLKKLSTRSRLFRKNFDRSLVLIQPQMHKLKEKEFILQECIKSNKTTLQEKNQHSNETWTVVKSFFDSSTKLVGDSLTDTKRKVELLCKFSAGLDCSRIAEQLKIFQQNYCEFMSHCNKDLTDHKEYVTAVGSNILDSINEITISGQQYIDTSREVFTENQKTLTDSMELQKTHRLDFEEKYKSAIDFLKQMKCSSDAYFKKTNEQSLACKNNLEARRVSLTQSKEIINTWQRQYIIKVNAFAQNVAKNRETQKEKLANTKKLLTDTINCLLENKFKTATVLDKNLIGLLLRQQKNFSRREEQLLSASYFKEFLCIINELTDRTSSLSALEGIEKNELIKCLDDFVTKAKDLCSKKKTKCTYLVNQIDHGLETLKLAKIKVLVSSAVFPSKLPTVTESTEESEDDSSALSSVTLVPEPNLEKVICELPKHEGTLRERCKKRKRKSRRRKEFEESKAQKELSESKEIEKGPVKPGEVCGAQVENES